MCPKQQCTAAWALFERPRPRPLSFYWPSRSTLVNLQLGVDLGTASKRFSLPVSSGVNQPLRGVAVIPDCSAHWVQWERTKSALQTGSVTPSVSCSECVTEPSPPRWCFSPETQWCRTFWPAPPWLPRWGTGWTGASKSTRSAPPSPACWSYVSCACGPNGGENK